MTDTTTTGRRTLVRPELRKELALTVALVLGISIYPLVAGSLYWGQITMLANLYLVATVGLNILRSEAGQMSFGHGAVFGSAAYATAMAAGIAELPFAAAAVVGFLTGLAVGVLLALPSLRVQGYYLGFVTMAGALAFPQLLFVFEEQTHALTGISVPVPGLNEIAFWRVSWLTLVIVLLALASVVGYAVIRSSRLGRQMRVVGASPEAAVTLGLHPGRLRMLAFAIASAITALAGVLYIPLIQYVAPGSFTIALSVLLYFIVVIGGPGTILGPLVGVGLLYVLPNAVLADVGEYRLLIYGGIAFVVMFLLPEGVVGSVHALIARLRRRDVGGSVSLGPVLAAASEASRREHETTAGEVVLSAENLSRSFGSVKALDDVSFTVRSAQIHGIVGPNGSGKTTLLNSLSGLIRLDRGTVVLHGQDMSSAGPVQRARRGMARTFQAPRLFGDLSVWENIDVGRRSAGGWLDAGLADVRAQWDATPGDVLPHAQQRFLEVIRVLRQDPSIVVLDEPAAGLSQSERQEFGRLLRSVVEATGAAVVIVEHDLELVWQIADQISVVDAGQVRLTGTPQELRHHADINHLFAGVQHA
ncbi:MAG: ATP-binding cassette domain-containing protein [Aeromicrobium erythreum]